MTLVHATCVAWDDHGILLQGPSGAGKSDLALRLIDSGARLIADDQVSLRRDGDTLVATAPASLEGWLEVRGIGICAVPCAAAARIVATFDLVPPDRIDRLPVPRRWPVLGLDIPCFSLAPFEVSAVVKVRLAVSVATGNSGLRQ